MSNILLVEDNRPSRDALSKILRLSGYTVVCATDGIEGLEAMDRDSFDLVLLDLMMPRMDGVMFLEQIRRKPEWQKLPVIILTAGGDPTMVADAARLGAGTCLIKARFTIPELTSQIRSHLQPIPPSEPGADESMAGVFGQAERK